MIINRLCLRASCNPRNEMQGDYKKRKTLIKSPNNLGNQVPEGGFESVEGQQEFFNISLPSQQIQRICLYNSKKCIFINISLNISLIHYWQIKDNIKVQCSAVSKSAQFQISTQFQISAHFQISAQFQISARFKNQPGLKNQLSSSIFYYLLL